MTNLKNRKCVFELNGFTPQKETIILLDTNILINIFTPYNRNSQNNYAELWKRLKKSGAKLIVSSVQLSEFINRCIRIEFKLYKDNVGRQDMDYKKDYRPTDHYRERMDDILSIVTEDIVKNFLFVDDKFSEMNTCGIFRLGFSYDFNDALVVEIARKYSATLITDDADFGNYKIDFPVVTSNRLLLNMRH